MFSAYEQGRACVLSAVRFPRRYLRRPARPAPTPGQISNDAPPRTPFRYTLNLDPARRAENQKPPYQQTAAVAGCSPGASSCYLAYYAARPPSIDPPAPPIYKQLGQGITRSSPRLACDCCLVALPHPSPV